jgi:5-methyltetrahydropteroyltriglutamate--homocysteine methyltransferase
VSQLQPDEPQRHPFKPAVEFDGGDMDCGSGLLLQIRRRIDPLDPGQLLEIRSSEPSVAEDLPAWCRMTGNELVSTWHDAHAARWSFLVSKNRFNPVAAEASKQPAPLGPTPSPKSALTGSWRRSTIAWRVASMSHGFRSWPTRRSPL